MSSSDFYQCWEFTSLMGNGEVVLLVPFYNFGGLRSHLFAEEANTLPLRPQESCSAIFQKGQVRSSSTQSPNRRRVLEKIPLHFNPSTLNYEASASYFFSPSKTNFPVVRLFPYHITYQRLRGKLHVIFIKNSFTDLLLWQIPLFPRHSHHLLNSCGLL